MYQSESWVWVKKAQDWYGLYARTMSDIWDGIIRLCCMKKDAYLHIRSGRRLVHPVIIEKVIISQGFLCPIPLAVVVVAFLWQLLVVCRLICDVGCERYVVWVDVGRSSVDWGWNGRPCPNATGQVGKEDEEARGDFHCRQVFRCGFEHVLYLFSYVSSFAWVPPTCSWGFITQDLQFFLYPKQSSR